MTKHHLKTIIAFVGINALVTFMIFKESLEKTVIANLITATIVFVIFHKD